MLEPAALVAAALVAQRPQQAPLLLRVRRDHPALAGRDLLVRVEREDRGRAVRAERPALVLAPSASHESWISASPCFSAIARSGSSSHG